MQNTPLLLCIPIQSIPFLYCGRIICSSSINLYRLLLDLMHCWVSFKESLSPVTSKSRWFSAVRRMELKDTLRAIVDLVEQCADSKAVHSIDIG